MTHNPRVTTGRQAKATTRMPTSEWLERASDKRWQDLWHDRDAKLGTGEAMSPWSPPPEFAISRSAWRQRLRRLPMRTMATTRRRTRITLLVVALVAAAAAESSLPDHRSSLEVTKTLSSGATASTEITDSIISDVLARVRRWQQKYYENDPPSLPFVTASFAQSLDGQLAVWNGEDDGDTSSSSNYPLSCDASRRLTHALRSIHDGILVGGATLSIDNPRLTNRLWKERPQEEGQEHDGRYRQPMPIVLDTHLRHLTTVGLENLRCGLADSIAGGNIGKGTRAGQTRPIKMVVCCSRDAAAAAADASPTTTEGSLVLLDGGRVALLPCDCRNDDPDRVDLADALRRLTDECNIRSIMVEGGPNVLTSFFSLRGDGPLDFVHAICVTIAPKLLRCIEWSGEQCNRQQHVPSLSPIYGRHPVDLLRSEEQTSSETNCKLSSLFLLLGTDCILLSEWPRSP